MRVKARQKVLDWAGVRKALEARRKRALAGGKKLRVVFTNGCFDLLHAGHVEYLRHAASLGDVLVVGLNADSSVSKIKPGRPIVPEKDRAVVLASLEAVDYVTLFSEDTPYDLIKFLSPDVLVKGGDWKVGEIVGHDIVPDTRSLPFVEGLSTTGIIERIRARS